MYLSGAGVDRDLSIAKNLYQKSCDLNMGVACGILGNMYYLGKGTETEPNIEAAITNMKKGCDLNDSDSCKSLGLLYSSYSSSKVEPDETAANIYFQKGCDLNNGDACAYLGAMYYAEYVERDQDFEQKIASAKPLLEKACALRSGIGCHWLGDMYESGNGVKRDLAYAKTLFQQGCTFNNPDSCVKLQQLNQYYKELAPKEAIANQKQQDQDIVNYQKRNNQMQDTLEQTRKFVIEQPSEADVFNIQQHQ